MHMLQTHMTHTHKECQTKKIFWKELNEIDYHSKFRDTEDWGHKTGEVIYNSLSLQHKQASNKTKLQGSG